MAITNDNQFELQSAGQADWDSGLNANFTLLERGYHQTAVAGMAINTGYALWQSSAGYWFHFNPNSEAIRPHALALFAANSGESLQALVFGIVRSLAIHSAIPQGGPVFVSVATPGFLVGSFSGARRAVGRGIVPGLFFDANFGADLPENLSRVASVEAVVNSAHYLSWDIGRHGWVRQLDINATTADLVSLTLYSNSARSTRLYETFSGGVTASGSFMDRAGFPYENTDPATISGLIYGTLQLNSGAVVTSANLSVTINADRFY